MTKRAPAIDKDEVTRSVISIALFWLGEKDIMKGERMCVIEQRTGYLATLFHLKFRVRKIEYHLNGEETKEEKDGLDSLAPCSDLSTTNGKRGNVSVGY